MQRNILDIIERMEEVIDKDHKECFDFKPIKNKIKVTKEEDMYKCWEQLNTLINSKESLKKHMNEEWFQEILSIFFNKPVSEIVLIYRAYIKPEHLN